MKTYPLADRPTLEEFRKFGLEPHKGEQSGRLVYPSSNKLKAMSTGVKRSPRKGEWYLSGAIVEAYKALNDLSTSYHIAKLVRVEIKTVETIVKENS